MCLTECRRSYPAYYGNALVAVRRALEFAKSAGVASLTLLSAQQPPADGNTENPMEDGLPQDKYYTQVTVAADVAGALPRVAKDFDIVCISAAHADTLIPVLFGEEDSRIDGTIVLVYGPEREAPTILESLVNSLPGT
jgi:hypothetical protein